jgi:hypothetical protein
MADHSDTELVSDPADDVARSSSKRIEERGDVGVDGTE